MISSSIRAIARVWDVSSDSQTCGEDGSFSCKSVGCGSLRTGSLNACRESQEKWVTNVEPRVEDNFGFVETFHDPQGVRAEFQGLVAVKDDEESAAFGDFVAQATAFLRLLPWSVGSIENNGKGPREEDVFEALSFISIHGGYVSALILCFVH